MGRSPRPKPTRLAEKLLQIRTALGLSRNGMIRRMGVTDELLREEISLFEHGVRVQSLPVLLEYACAANVYVDLLIDDAVDLPEDIPAKSKTEGVKRPAAKKPPRAVSRRGVR